MRLGPALPAMVAVFAAALVINLFLLPGDHLISSLYLIPVLIACHWLRPGTVAVSAAIATVLYVVSAAIEDRPLTVWPFGLLAFLLAGYLTVRFSLQREEIARRAQQEEAARQRLQTFLGMVAHDLAGGLTNVLAGVEMLRRIGNHAATEHERVAVVAVEGGARQMQRLLEDLRSAAAIGAGRFEVHPQAMDLATLARQIVDQQRVATNHHRLILDAPERLEGNWDRERIAQLLTNLISNAVKYSPEGGDVRVAIRATSDGAVISVRDRGIGIDPGQRRSLFQPFSRIQQRTEVPGTGLGLWIAKAIVDGHGGRIWVESEVGQGSTFSAVLPTLGGDAERPDRSSPGGDDRMRGRQPAARGRPHVASLGRSAA